MIKVIFRADGNSEIGLGHVIRSLALADMLKEEFECIFATRFLSRYIKQEASFCSDIIKLSEDNQEHFDEFLTHLSGNEIVVLDNYFFDTEYQKLIKGKACKLVCIDDMHDKHYVADVVINHAEGLKKSDFSIEDYTGLLLGYDYALLRKPFLRLAQISKTKENIRTGNFDVLVCIGGADPLNLIEKFVDFLSKQSFVKTINLILGTAMNNRKEFLRDNVRTYKNLNANQMSELMTQADVGIFPASTTAVEACAVRLPFLTGFYVDNQKEIYASLMEKSLAIGLGDLRSLEELVFRENFAKLLNLETQLDLVDNQRRYIDGDIVNRFISEFRKLH